MKMKIRTFEGQQKDAPLTSRKWSVAVMLPMKLVYSKEHPDGGPAQDHMKITFCLLGGKHLCNKQIQ